MKRTAFAVALALLADGWLLTRPELKHVNHQHRIIALIIIPLAFLLADVLIGLALKARSGSGSSLYSPRRTGK